MMFFKYLIPFATVVALLGCGGHRSSEATEARTGVVTDSLGIIHPDYAKGFNVSYQDDMVLLNINDPENKEAEQFHFALTDKYFSGMLPEGYIRINIPVESAICMTSLQLSNFLKLDIPEKVVGITSTRHLHNVKMNEQLKKGQTHKIGIEGNFDNEVIMAINPDVIFISPFKRGGYDAIRNVDIPMIPHLGYKELTPLGQAEWIKVIGLLTGKAADANLEFAGIEKRYNDLKAMVDTVSYRPTVFSGEMRGGNWYAVGGKSFLAQLFRDAGGDYFLKDNNESGGVTLDYETVYTNAAHADYWRIVNSFDGDYNYNVLKEQDNRYTDFDAWKKHGVIYCNMKEVPFYERMPVEPEVVLSDFIHVFHPDILPDHEPSYYHLLEK
ncbi:ABC transporter substrate-binding protein [Bacteroides caecimuris]|uniref:ABC transporter substrate-binding protein n=3 Tax=Bacteroidales TaxID=171549 RepID=UPI00263AEEE1|nr:ABC transporter substrate-binding protein [Bacteroides caecimuris]